MNRSSKESGPIPLRFSLRHLLLAMTAASVLMAFATLMPVVVRWFVISMADLGLVAGLVAGIMVWSDRRRIACVAALVPLLIATFSDRVFGAPFHDFPDYARSLGLGLGVRDIVSFASRWADVALSGTVAYVVAGRLTPKE